MWLRLRFDALKLGILQHTESVCTFYEIRISNKINTNYNTDIDGRAMPLVHSCNSTKKHWLQTVQLYIKKALHAWSANNQICIQNGMHRI